MTSVLNYDSVSYDKNSNSLKILDQTLLPSEEKFLEIINEECLVDAIESLKVRGAPAIGIAGALGIAVLLSKSDIPDKHIFILEFNRLKNLVTSARPTAVNLENYISRMEQKMISDIENHSVTELMDLLLHEALKIKEEDIAANIMMAENAISLLKPGFTVMTYCNAGHLAVSRYGTALAPLYLAKERGYNIKVYVCETRPLLQGARLTAYELQKAGIETILICDNMAASVMSQGKVDLFISGCDRIAVNGDTANKIGTSMVSISASYYGVPHIVIGPESTIDYKCENGCNIKIELRQSSEVTDLWYKKRMAPENVKVYNPAFDITPAKLISAIINEKGVFKYPYNFKNI